MPQKFSTQQAVKDGVWLLQAQPTQDNTSQPAESPPTVLDLSLAI